MSKQIHDFRWTSEGDFALDTVTEDFLSTEKEAYRGLIQKVQTRIGSNRGDWASQPDVGADLEEFRGELNTQEVAQRIIDRLFSELVGTGTLTSSEIVVDAVPAGQGRIVVVLFITPTGSRQAITLSFNYDLRHNKVVPR